MALRVKKGEQQHRHPNTEKLRDQPMKRLTVNVPEDVHRRLKIHATSEDRQMSEIVLGLVTQYLDGKIDLNSDHNGEDL